MAPHAQDGLKSLLAACVLLAALGMACGTVPVVRSGAQTPLLPSASAAPAQSPSPSAAAAQSPSPSAGATQSPLPSPSPAARYLCRLPIDRTPSGGKGAFVPVPTTPLTYISQASIPLDPASAVALPDGEAASGLSFSASAQKWLPVRREWATPAGDQYLYIDSQHELELVNVGTGTGTPLEQAAGLILIGVDAGNAYLANADGSVPAGVSGLIAVPLDGTAAHTLATTGSWTVIGGGWAWGTETAGNLVPTLLSGTPPPGNVLEGLNLTDGTVTTVLTRADAAFQVLGVDAGGRPLLVYGQNQAGVGLWSVPSTGQVRLVGFGTAIWDAFGDARGIWFVEGMSAAIYFAPSGMGAQPYSSIGVYGRIRLAGACV